MTGTPLMWSLFATFVFVALFVDFFALRKQGAHQVTIREAAIWSLVWVAVSFIFVGGMWWHLGGMSPDPALRAVANDKSLEFITGYLVEKALAVDNIFVFLMLFTYFSCRQCSVRPTGSIRPSLRRRASAGTTMCSMRS